MVHQEQTNKPALAWPEIRNQGRRAKAMRETQSTITRNVHGPAVPVIYSWKVALRRKGDLFNRTYIVAAPNPASAARKARALLAKKTGWRGAVHFDSLTNHGELY